MLVAVRAVIHLPRRIYRENIRASGYFGTMAGGCGSQGRRHRTHAADRDVPVSGTPAQHVVQEADVLPQRRVVQSREGADQRVGRNHPPDQVVSHRAGNGVSDRLVDHGLPGERRRAAGAVHDGAACLLPSAQRLEQRRPEPFGHQSATAVEGVEAMLVSRGADRSEGARAVRPDEQTGPPGGSRVRRIRRIRSTGQPDMRAQVVDDAAG